jgi:cob(I)alamin adenosyltransferase
MGDVDELNATLGWALNEIGDERARARLEAVQHDLFAIGSELATPAPQGDRKRPETPGIPMGRVGELEAWIDEVEDALPPLTAFILPGGVPGASALHLARTVCRRAERSVVRLAESESIDLDVVPYLNRLSDLLFVLARAENHRSGGGDVHWMKPTGRPA